MKKQLLIKIILIGIILIISSHVYNNYFTATMIVGTYVNRNYENSPVAPHFSDTIKLLKNDTFESKGWGKGTYEISYSIKGTSIKLNYRNEYGYSGFNTHISRVWYGNPKIIMFIDLQNYYEKIL